MKRAICYFSATGNGFDIARRLKSELETGDLYYMPHTSPDTLQVYDEIVLITPLYSFGTPMIVKDFMKQLSEIDQLRSKRYYAILSYGGFRANGVEFLEREFRQYQLECYGVGFVRMPANFSLVAVPPEFFIRKFLKNSQKKIIKIGRAIKHQKRIAVKRKRMFAFLDGVHKKNIGKLRQISDRYTVSEHCTLCGSCIELCPTKNIYTDMQGKIAFGGKCIGCLGCYNRCEPRAILYKGKQKKRRYKNPQVDFSCMK